MGIYVIVVIVSLTQAGRDLEGRVMEAWKRLETNTTKGISEEEKALFLTIVQKIVTNLES
jgi:DNA-binding MarR family transcriptional regulator